MFSIGGNMEQLNRVSKVNEGEDDKDGTGEDDEDGINEDYEDGINEDYDPR